MNHMECISILTNEKDQEFIDMVIRANYGIKIKGEINYLGDVPQEYKINELENIERFYNLKEAVKFNYKNLKLYMVFNMYITPDRRILNKLINQLNNGINSTEFAEKPTEVTRILGEYLNKRNIKEKEIISLENDLLCLNLDTTLKNKILECIILQDKGFERFESFYKLFCTIKYNCRECNVRKSCDYSGECENSNIKNKSKNFDKITIINFLEEFFELIWQRVLYLK